jgi:hypothetical protein
MEEIDVRALSSILAGTAAAAALAFTATPAQAAGDPVYLYTTTGDRCTMAGDNGVNGGVFATYHCQNGFAGYSLSVTRTAGHTGASTYIGTLDTLAQCQMAGDNGVFGRVFSGYTCQTGFVGYSLIVRD